MEPECKVRLEVFEGPLDLLLHLITKNKLDITDIPISLVTNQYLEYLELLKALDIEVAAEYLLMAATLIHIKSRMLLPQKESETDDDEDPRLQITIALNELKRAKELADKLNACPMLGRDVFIREFHKPESDKEKAEEQGIDTMNVILLVEAFRKVIKGGNLPRTIEIEQARVKLSDRIKELEELIRNKKRLSFFGLFPEKMERMIIIVTFLAILELAKRGLIRIFQTSEGSDIIIVERSLPKLHPEEN